MKLCFISRYDICDKTERFKWPTFFIVLVQLIAIDFIALYSSESSQLLRSGDDTRQQKSVPLFPTIIMSGYFRLSSSTFFSLHYPFDKVSRTLFWRFSAYNSIADSFFTLKIVNWPIFHFTVRWKIIGVLFVMQFELFQYDFFSITNLFLS